MLTCVLPLGAGGHPLLGSVYPQLYVTSCANEVLRSWHILMIFVEFTPPSTRPLGPSPVLSHYVINFDTVAMEITIPRHKLEEVISMATTWSYKQRATRKELQSLAGKFNHIAHCVAPAVSCPEFSPHSAPHLRVAPFGSTKVYGAMWHGSCHTPRNAMASSSSRRSFPSLRLNVMRARVEQGSSHLHTITVSPSPRRYLRPTTSPA